MNNDLISREALKNNEPHYDEEGYRIFYESEIDKAPTVDIPTELCKGCRFLKDCETCEEKLSPHWIKIFENPYTNGYVCSVCGHKIQVTEQFLSKITECEACGADMQKGGNE